MSVPSQACRVELKAGSRIDSAVGAGVGSREGAGVGLLGAYVGRCEGAGEGRLVGLMVGACEGAADGARVLAATFQVYNPVVSVESTAVLPEGAKATPLQSELVAALVSCSQVLPPVCDT